ncbi:MAG: HD domain-containing protein [Deltaproteobacteria bacterium]|nr:HD domain-containing protein [Deltaproteobacteria bacterium]
MNKPKYRFIQTLFDQGGEVYEVGGTVRDHLLHRSHKDNDLLVTKLSYTQILDILKPLGEVFTVGKSFGVIKFHPKESPDLCFDLALPRKEVSTGVGHRDFEVDFNPDLPVEFDLARRDFTINAMALHLKKQTLIDPFGGEEDLKGKILRAVSDRAFEEDPLRLLRGIQFAARFELIVEEKTLASIKKNASLIQTVSVERIAEEIRKLFLARQPSRGFVLMQQTGLLGHVFPELEQNVGVKQGNKIRNDDVFMHTMRVLDASREDKAIPSAGDLELMLSALYHDVGKARTRRFVPEKNRITFYGHQTLSNKMARKRFQVLKLSTIGVDVERVANLIEHHMFQTKSFFSDRAIRRFINKVGPDLILKLVDLRLADNRGGKYPEGIHGVLRLRKKIAEELANQPPLSPKDLAVSGFDIMKLGVPEGPLVGQILKDLLEVVIDNPERNNQEELIQLAKEIIQKEQGKK